MQAKNSASLPGIVKNMLMMPDGHEGYGFPVGGVAAFDAETGIVSPGVVGFDINCGIRLIKTNMTVEDVRPKLAQLMDQAVQERAERSRQRDKAGFHALRPGQGRDRGRQYVVEKGFGFKDDIDRIEENGCMAGADPRR